MITIELRALDSVEKYFKSLPQKADQAARFAVRYATKQGATMAKREIARQVNLSQAYIGNPADQNAPLHITKFPKPGDNEGIIGARPRATSLARFATGAVTFNTRKPVRVRVHRGLTKVLRERAFYIKLRKGAALTQDNYNLGIAVRLKKGETLENKHTGAKTGPGIAVLYAPSVEQVFQSVNAEILPDVSLALEKEFLRQMARFDV
jgi:hypothetical protein